MLSRSLWKDLNQISPLVVNSLIASEDKTFKQHIGIDFFGIVRAFLRNLSEMSVVEGASTITQQLARTLYLTQERSLTRKIKEGFISLWLERILTKEEILTMYINSIYTGNGLYGLPSASHYYFGKDINELSLPEISVLVGLLKSPENFNPFSNAKLALSKGKVVLMRLEDENYISSDDFKVLVKELENISFAPKPENNGVDEELFWRVAREAEELGFDLDQLKQGYKIFTYLNSDLMQSVHNNTSDNMAVEAVNPSTGQVLAYRGIGVSYPQGTRQIGSSIKPLYYYFALLQGWSPEDYLTDMPIRIGEWTPENFDRQYTAVVTLRDALVKSRNIPSINLFLQLGKTKVVSFLKNELMLDGFYPDDLTVALGTVESAPEELLKAYCPVFNGGVVLKPRIISRIEDPYGTVVYNASPEVIGKVFNRVMDPTTVSAVMVRILKEVVQRGTGNLAKLSSPVAGKTGTSENTAWFIGGDESFLMCVAVDGKNLTGGGNAAPVWKQIVSAWGDYSGRFTEVSTEEIFTKRKQATSTMNTVDIDRIIFWVREGSITLSNLAEIISVMDSDKVKDFLTKLNEVDPDLAHVLWEKLKELKNW